MKKLIFQKKEKFFWINFYNSYLNGYNATKGGDGKVLYNHDLILERLKAFPFPCEVAKEFGCCVDIVSDIAKNN